MMMDIEVSSAGLGCEWTNNTDIHVVFCVQITIDMKSHLEQKGKQLRKNGFQLQPHVVILAENVID